MRANMLTPRELEAICHCNTMACWWPSQFGTRTEPAWLCIADELHELIMRPGDADLKIKLQQAYRYALLQYVNCDHRHHAKA